ncbi:NF-kappa-B inhibitor-interacting Ras protein 1 [Paragonimus heterotremus]|uniref:NF-kappa-B inhibitor-interacting Ras protein 1 n=1 Tax=Paragonimus heterotremus TaxID=100268 RepID=A0A8J4TGC1_9TREM|nr:NF-kappa-B inhibitor-interacting Ras protein 1 [Paragonimus heterotremus]
MNVKEHGGWKIEHLSGSTGEPACLLLPNQTTQVCGTDKIGPCTSLVVVSDDGSNGDGILLASGHLNGWMILWSLERRRSNHQWLAHPRSQVTSLHCWPKRFVISQGRDGFIRFWTLLAHGTTALKSTEIPKQGISEIATCDFTFCAISFWPAVCNLSANGFQSDEVYYLAHIPIDDNTPDSGNKTCAIEVIQFPDNVIVCHSGSLGSDDIIKGLSQMGMCMALQGVSQDTATPFCTSRCLYLAAYEAGHLLLFGDGLVLVRLDSCLGTAVPIMSIGLQPALCGTAGRLILVGGPIEDNVDSSNPPRPELGVIRLESSCTIGEPVRLTKISTKLTPAVSGIACVAWRADGRIVALGQWDGRLRLIESRRNIHSPKLRCLGWLTSLGGLGESELLGDWAATTVTQPHGPIVDQRSTTIRSCVFTPNSNWLISAAPANAGAVGSLLVWDVYRTSK